MYTQERTMPGLVWWAYLVWLYDKANEGEEDVLLKGTEATRGDHPLQSRHPRPSLTSQLIELWKRGREGGQRREVM